MDVICQRCATEYELDDALLSERGTMVQCTSCGEQFRVFRDGAGDQVPERWIVRQASGRELIFTSIRQLQRAIEDRRVNREDLLSRGTAEAKPLGALSELAPFFEGKPPAPSTRGTTTLQGMPRPPEPPLLPAAEPPPIANAAPTSPALDETPAPPPPRELSSLDLTPSLVDVETDPYPSLRHLPPRRPRGMRLVVGMVLFGMAGLAIFAFGRPLLDEMLSKLERASTKPDGRLDDLLKEGERALAKGDLESAKEAFAKASLLSEDHPQLLVDLARLACIQADLAWLKLRLSSDDPEALLLVAKRTFEDALARAEKAVARLVEVVPDAPTTQRARIDVKRIAGDLTAARALVPRTAAIASQPETTYVHAMLDLAEPSPNYPTIVERLRLALASEEEVLRARAVLVYAHARSNDLGAAKSELAKLLAARYPHPLAAELQAFLSAGDGKAPEAAKTVAPPEAEEASRPQKITETEPSSTKPELRASPHELLKQASRAKSEGQLERAEQLYRQALAQNPADTEALGGLGDIARSRGQTRAARDFYEQAHRQNPSYLPVLVALADMRWASGDREGARTLYRQIFETAPGTSFATRARERLTKEEDATSHSASPSSEPTIEDPKPPTSDLPPDIDTSDLPGFQR